MARSEAAKEKKKAGSHLHRIGAEHDIRVLRHGAHYSGDSSDAKTKNPKNPDQTGAPASSLSRMAPASDSTVARRASSILSQVR